MNAGVVIVQQVSEKCSSCVCAVIFLLSGRYGCSSNKDRQHYRTARDKDGAKQGPATLRHAVDARQRISFDRAIACWLHAVRHFGAVGPESHDARQAATREPALSAGVDFTDLSASSRSIP